MGKKRARKPSTDEQSKEQPSSNEYMGRFTSLAADVLLHGRDGTLPAHTFILAVSSKVLAAHPRFSRQPEGSVVHSDELVPLKEPFTAYRIADIAAVLHLFYQPDQQEAAYTDLVPNMHPTADERKSERAKLTALKDRLSLLHTLDAAASADKFEAMVMQHVLPACRRAATTEEMLQLAIASSVHQYSKLANAALDVWWGAGHCFAPEIIPSLSVALAQQLPRDMLVSLAERTLKWFDDNNNMIYIAYRCPKCKRDCAYAEDCHTYHTYTCTSCSCRYECVERNAGKGAACLLATLTAAASKDQGTLKPLMDRISKAQQLGG